MKVWTCTERSVGKASILFNSNIFVSMKLCITTLEYNTDLSRLKVTALDNNNIFKLDISIYIYKY